jgi:glyoxylase-like metal-dependent hydrolase (beta-lactamase superfamily II)
VGGSIERVLGGARDLVSVFIVEHRGVLSIVDSGSPGAAAGRVLRALRRRGRRPEDVRQIVLTHCHGDHSGDAKRLKEATGATVVAGAPDVPTIEGRGPYPEPNDRVMHFLLRRLTRYPRLGVDRAIDGREEIEGGLVIVPAPGHTQGHVAVLAPDLSTLFTGDVLWHIGPLRPSLPRFTQDPERNAETIRELAALGVDRVEVAHGPSVSGEQLRRLAARG